MSLNVTRNLYVALKRLGRQPEADRPHLWVDAICINQEDLVERAHQVLLMREIYHVASRVVIWLGEPSRSDDDELGCILELKQYIVNASATATPWQNRPPMRKWVVRQPLMRFIRLLGNKYFSRLWMVTEVMAAQDAIIRLGGSSVAWSDFLMVCQRIHGVRRNSSIPDAFLTNLRRARSMLTKQPDFSITHLLSRFRGLQCSDDRDRVFALLTTSKEVQERYHYLPDYNLTTAEVYADIVKFIIRETKSLDVLSCNQAPGRSRNLPSWAVDWSRDWLARVLEPRFSQSRSQHAFQACAGRDAIMLESSKDQLVLKGISIHSIASTYQPSRQDIEALTRDPDTALDAIIHHLHASSPASEALTEVLRSNLFRTLTIDAAMPKTALNEAPDSSLFSFTTRALGCCLSKASQIKPDGDATTADIKPQTQPRSLQIYDSGFRGNSEPPSIDLSSYTPRPPTKLDQILNNTSPPTIAPQPEIRPRFTYPEPTIYPPNEANSSITCPDSVIAWITSFLHGRKLFRTKSGHFGLGPGCAQAGDKVGVLLGADVPFVLRTAQAPDDSTKIYHVVGECYLHGFMDGEALASTKEGRKLGAEEGCEVITLV